MSGVNDFLRKELSNAQKKKNSKPFPTYIKKYSKKDNKTFLVDKDVDLSATEFKGGVISIFNANIAEVINTRDIFLRDFDVPSITECALFFLLLRVEHFHINVKKTDWLNKPESKDSVEDLYKHLYATIKFIEATSNDPVASERAINKLKDYTDNAVVYTRKLVTAARRVNKSTHFTKAFATENDFLKWMEDTRQTATFPPDLADVYSNALNNGNFPRAADFMSLYIKDLGLERVNTAK